MSIISVKSNEPLVCVCIPCYNAEKTIIETLKSIQKQTYSNFEIHIFDNASTDKTVEKVQLIDDKRIYLHIANETGSAESNFTRCLNLGRGDYTAIYHADDLYVRTIIEKEVEFLEKNKSAQGALTFATQIDARGEQLKTYLAPKILGVAVGQAKVYGAKALIKAVLAHDNFLFCPSAMIRTKVCVENIRVWRGDLFKSGADLDVWLRLAELGGLGLLNEPLLKYRISDTQWTGVYRNSRLDKADTFLILDYWLKKDSVTKEIDQSDEENYRTLLKYDTIGRVLNMIRQGDTARARETIYQENNLMKYNFKFSIKSAKSFRFLVLQMMLDIMLMPFLGKLFRKSLLKMLEKVRL